MNCEKCKYKIEYTYFKHISGVINLCYDCGLETFDIKGQKFFKNTKFVEEFTLEFKDTDKYENLKQNGKRKEEYKQIKDDINALHKEILTPPISVGRPSLYKRRLK